MKEFIEKLIGRLEEQAEQYRRRGFEHEEKGYSAMADKYYGKQCSYLHSIEIVNQLAEEYKSSISTTDYDLIIKFIESEIERTSSFTEHDTQINIMNYVQQLQEQNNNGWISCSEKCPPSDTYCLITDYKGNIRVEKHISGNEWLAGFNYVIAWQPLPAPYQPKGE